MRLVGLIVVLLVLALGGLAGYAYLGDMKAAPTEMRVPVELDLGAGEPTPPAPAEGETVEGEAAATPAPEAAQSGQETGAPQAEAQSQANDLD